MGISESNSSHESVEIKDDHEPEPESGIFMGVNQDFEARDVVDTLDFEQWSTDCKVLTEWMESSISMVAENDDQKLDEIKQCRDRIKDAAALVNLWISTYYPAAVIDQNIVNVVH